MTAGAVVATGGGGYVIASAFMRGMYDKAAEVAAADGIAGSRDLRRVLRALARIQPLLEAAERRQWEDERARRWLRGLKQAAYDLDDLLDSLPAAAADPDKRASRCFRTLSRHPPLGELHAIRERIEGIEDGRRFSLLRSLCSGGGGVGAGNLCLVCVEHGRIGAAAFPATRGSLVDVYKKEGEKRKVSLDIHGSPAPGMVGMEEAKEGLVKMLLETSQETNLGAVSIVGPNGVGKTTLARLVFNDGGVADHFELRLWIDAHEVFDTGELFRSMLQKADDTDIVAVAGAGSEVEERLVECLFQKRFLLVLDDPWYDKIRWRTVTKYLEVGGKGSKVVIVTDDESRMAKALSSGVGAAVIFQVRGLSAEDCWELLKAYAFADEAAATTAELEEIGKEIARRMDGLPLSVNMIGSLLRRHPDRRYWKKVRDDKIWRSLPDPAASGDVGVVAPPAVWLCYRFLPSQIKQCLAFCSAFSKHHEYERDSTTQMWTAQGLIQPENSGGGVEDRANDVFDYLVSRSFIQVLDGESNKYVMSSHVHQLVVSLSQDETLQLGVGGGDASSITAATTTKVRHLLLFSDHLKEEEDVSAFSPARFERVRTLVFYGLTRPEFDLDAFLAKLKRVRVSCFNAPFIRELPKPICGMKQLRYLDLRFTAVRALPEEACGSLSKLQTLKLHKDAELPEGLWKLGSLRHLEANDDKKSRIYRAGKLTLLQELRKIAVSNDAGFGIEELGSMNELRGELLILGLENVRGGEEAMKANLSSKAHLRKLELEWSPLLVGFSSLPENPNWDSIIEGLRPHQDLQSLTIRNHLGSKFPSWLGDQWLAKLQSIEIYDCHGWTLPPLGQLPLLKSLTVEFSYRAMLDSRGNMPNVRHLGHGFYGRGPVLFPVLESLRISGIREWEEWEAVEDGCELFPNLCTLVVDNCVNMKALPELPPTLRELNLKEVGLMELPGITGCNTSPLALSSLYISSCRRLTSMEGLMKHDLTALRSLKINRCKKIASLPNNGFADLVSLENLEISMCPNLASSSDAALPSSLLHLRICGCPFLTDDSFFGCLEKLHSLTTLHVGGAGKSLGFLPGELLRHLSSLEELKIEDCEGLQVLGFMAVDSLKRLEVSGCPKLAATSFVSDWRAWLPLEYLRIKNCSLSILASHLLQGLSNLQELTIDGCAGDTFPEGVERELAHLVSLRRLAITQCFDLQSLPRELGSIPGLEELCIIACPKVLALPERPLSATLAMFSVDDCPNLVDRCKEKGEDWQKIEHVATKYLNFTKKDGMAIGGFVSLDHLDRKWIPGMRNGSSS